jgi:hypothetical protein
MIIHRHDILLGLGEKKSIGWDIFFLLEVSNVWVSNTYDTFGKVVRAEF